MRTFDTGAVRDTETGKLDYEGFFSPQAMEAFAKYMDFHREMPDGSRRDSDNWQKGFPFSSLMKSMWRHFFSLWRWHRSAEHKDDGCVRPFQHPVLDLCGVMFNAQSYLKKLLDENPEAMTEAMAIARLEREQRRRVAQPSPWPGEAEHASVVRRSGACQNTEASWDVLTDDAGQLK